MLNYNIQNVKLNSYIPKPEFDVGPGDFKIPDTNLKKSYSMASRPIDINKMNFVPGPGHYDV